MRLVRDATWPDRNGVSEDMHEISLIDKPARDHRPLAPRGTRPECLKSTIHEIFFIACMALTAASPVFLQRSTVVVTASIANELRMSPAELAWATAGSGLTTGALLLPFGHVADTCSALPRRTLLLASLLAFSVLVGATCFSMNAITLDVMSGLAGVACAANVPVAVGILSLAYPVPSRRKNLAFSTFLMGTPAATIIGGLGSGGIAKMISWKAPFACLGVLYAIITVLAWFLVPHVPEPDRNPRSINTLPRDPNTQCKLADLEDPEPKPQRPSFDWLGVFLLTTGVLLFTVSLTIGPEGPEPWKTPTVICLLTFGVMSLGCFIIWEAVTRTPMIPPAVWRNLCVTLITICTFFASMAYYSQLFWLSMFMQQLQHLEPLDVALRLLPQALVGLLLSPLVGLILHRVPGTTLLLAAVSSLTLSNIPLIFLKPDSNYFASVLPPLVMSTLGMDWVLNIGSLHVLAILPLHQHSAGASLLQTAARLGVPFGVVITTSIWSSYDGRGDDGRLEIAYSSTFTAIAAIASICLLLAPFIRIGRQGSDYREEIESETESIKPDCTMSVGSTSVQDKSFRPSKRWSLGETFSATSSVMGERSQRAPSLTMSLVSSTNKSTSTPRTESFSVSSTLPRNQRPVVWVVCEDCGTRKRDREQDKPGDPARYFGEVSDAASRPYPGRRRFPAANRQFMTHQMLTQGFQPYKD